MAKRHPGRTAETTDPGRRWSVRDAAGALLVGIVTLAVAVAFIAGRAPGADGLLAGAAFLGAALLLLGAPRRTGDTLHCVRCDHQVPPAHAAPGACPECGADLRPHGTTARGRRAAARWMLATGGGLLGVVVVSGALLVLDRAAPTLRWRFAPLPLVLRDLRDPAVLVTVPRWDALAQRALDARDRHRVIGALLDRRDAGGHAPAAGAWIARTLAADPAAALAARFYGGALAWEASVLPPGTDDAIVVRASGRTRAWSAPDTYVAVVLVAAHVDDEPVTRLDIAAHVLGGPADRPDTTVVGPRVRIPATGLEPGPRRLRLEFSVTVLPRRVAPVASGPVPPAAVWSGRRTVETTVLIPAPRPAAAGAPGA